MPTLWLSGGKLIVDSMGRPILCDTCPCGSPAPCSCPGGLAGTYLLIGHIKIDQFSGITCSGTATSICDMDISLSLVGDCATDWTVTAFAYACGRTVTARLTLDTASPCGWRLILTVGVVGGSAVVNSKSITGSSPKTSDGALYPDESVCQPAFGSISTMATWTSLVIS